VSYTTLLVLLDQTSRPLTKSYLPDGESVPGIMNTPVSQSASPLYVVPRLELIRKSRVTVTYMYNKKSIRKTYYNIYIYI